MSNLYLDQTDTRREPCGCTEANVDDNNHNEDACPLRAIDEVLMYNANVSQEQREEIMDQVFQILYNRWVKTKNYTIIYTTT